MNLLEMTKEIRDACNLSEHSAYTDNWIKDAINRWLRKLAKGVKIPNEYRLSPPFPALYTFSESTVSTTADVAYVAMPSNYSRGLKRVEYDGGGIDIIASFSKFMTVYGEQKSGDIVRCCLIGNYLHFRDVPESSVDLDLWHYTNPTSLSDATDSPDFVPVELHEDLVCGEICRQIYNKIEDEPGDRKTNTATYQDIVNSGLFALEQYIGFDADAQNYDDEWGSIP